MANLNPGHKDVKQQMTHLLCNPAASSNASGLPSEQSPHANVRLCASGFVDQCTAKRRNSAHN